MAHPLQRLWRYTARRRRAIITGLMCAIGATSIQLLGPWILRYAIDDLQLGVTQAKLFRYTCVMLSAALICGVFRFVMRRLLVGASRDIEYNIRNDFFAHLQRLPLAYYQTRRTGDLMARATNDLAAVRMMIGPAVMYIVTTSFLFVVAVGFMMSIDTRLTLVALIPLPLVSITVWCFGAAIQAKFDCSQTKLSEFTAVVQESLTAVRMVRAYGQEQAEIDRFKRANDEYVSRSRALIRVQGVFYPTLSLLLGIGGLIVLWLGSRDVILGRITLGQFVAFNVYLVMLSWPLIAFGWVTNLYERGTASWKRMVEVFDQPTMTNQRANSTGVESLSLAPSVEFRDLTFAYKEQPILQNVSLLIPAGQIGAIVGPTGCGKSTLISLIPRLYEPPPGSVFIGGVDVRSIPLSVLRRAVGMVSQEPYLFADTIARNISFGVPHHDGHKLNRPAAVARLAKDIEAFPNGWDTQVGERGLTLSGGQKQRIAIARALAISPSVLVLDDALSAVDACTEAAILSDLRRVMEKRTCIIISHRLSTVKHADVIVILDEQGRVVEQGTHDELVAAGGSYCAIYRRQLLEEELATCE
jgi:ATP-binding cassette subfamily B multidrug efflux pump